jgi:sugar lactone lactonase YvrE
MIWSFFFMVFWIVPVWGAGVLPAEKTMPLGYVLDGTVGGFGSVLGYFQFPMGISGDSQFVYVVDSGNGRIVKTDFYFSQWDSFQNLGEEDNPLDRPSGIVVEGTDIWVSDSQNHRLVRYSTQGIPQETVGEFGIFEGSFDTPRGMAARFGHLWVADSRNHRIQHFQNKVFSESFGSWGDDRDTLQEPYDILVLPTYELVISDRQQRRLAVFNELGQWVQDIVPVFAEGQPPLGRIGGLGMDQDGRIFVADPDHGRVVVLQRDGQVLAVLPVAAPEDVYAWGDLVFVTDSAKHRLMRFRRL